MNRFLIHAAYIAAFVLIFAGCKDDDPVVPPDEPAKEFSVSPTSINLMVGGETQIVVTPNTETYSFESTATSVATVSTTGLVKAESEGNATIKVSLGKTTKEVSVTVGALIAVSEIGVNPTSLELKIDEEVTIATALLPANYNEQGPFTLKWEIKPAGVATVDANGKVKAVGFGDATITVSLLNKPNVFTEIAVSVPEIPITEIQVPATLKLTLGETQTVTPILLPEEYSVADPSLIWASDNEAVTVTNGVIKAVNGGSATITVKLNSNSSVMATIAVIVYTNVIDVGTFTSVNANIVSSKVTFEKNGLILIKGIGETDIAKVYNRDFFIYNPDNGTLKFDGASGEWDVYYSATYKYFYVFRSTDRAPACHWGIGSGFNSAPVWHDDFNIDNWDWEALWRLPYFRLLDNGWYQATVYLAAYKENCSIEVWPQRAWGEPSVVSPAFITGDIEGIVLDGLYAKHNANSNFVPGYYRLTFDALNTRELNYKRLE